jgi:hypothetical protein
VKNVFLSHLYLIENDDFPRQARDKHKESTQKKSVSSPDPDSDEVDEVLSCLEQLSTEEIVTLYWTKNAAFGPVVDGVELTDTPHKLLQQGKIDRTGTLKAVMMGSTSEVRARKKSASF